MKTLFLSCLTVLLASAQPAFATGGSEAKIKIVNFTSAWCSACAIFDPRLEQALSELSDPEIAHVPVNMTESMGPNRDAFWAGLRASMTERGIGKLYESYMGFPNTGYAVIIAADTQEPLYCTMGPVAVENLKLGFELAKQRVAAREPYDRVPEGVDCPPSFQAQG